MRLLIVFFSSLLFASNLIIQYPNLKKYYYQNQIINLKIKIITPTDKNISIITPQNIEYNQSQKNGIIHILNLKYKNDLSSKKIFIIGNNIYKEINLNKLYKTKELENIPRFSHLLAQNLKILNPISSKFNTQKNMISFTVIAKNANLEDFKLDNVSEQNLSIISPKKATFFGYINKNLRKLTFYYFNTENENFKKISIPIKIKEDTISTQTDLNPEESKFFTPLNILTLLIIALGLSIFLIYQKIIFLIPPLFLIVYLGYKNLPKGEIILKPGTKVYILPTKNSTVFYKIKVTTKVKILKKLKEYTKIKINNKIGWVKNENN